MNGSNIRIEVLPVSHFYDNRDSLLLHTSYETETAFYTAVGEGNTEDVRRYFEVFSSGGIVVGKLSSDKLRQLKYWAVCCIAIATRYAIAGGLPENEAFNLSDGEIYKIDRMTSEEEIMQSLISGCMELTLKVQRAQKTNYPFLVRKCLKIINERLFEDLHMKRLAAECSVTKDYLSHLFKIHTGYTLPQYIKKERLKVSKSFLKEGITVSETAYLTGFSTESYFIKCFREEFGITPGEFVRK